MGFLSTACKSVFCFLVERICREYLYWFGHGPKCENKDSKRGAVCVDQFIGNLLDDGRYKLHPFQLNSSFLGFDAWLGLFSLRWEIKFGHGGISGLKTLRQEAVCSTMIKDLMHVNTSLRAGPLDFDSWLIFRFRGFEHVIFIRGALSDIECLCDFIINLEKRKGESFSYLLIREIKGMKIWVREGLGSLTWPVNLAIRLLIIFLKPFIRHAVERRLQKLVKDDFSNYEFQIQQNVETHSWDELRKMKNGRVIECDLGGPQIAQIKRSNFFTSSYWCKSEGSYLRRKSPVLPKDSQLNSEHRQSIGIETKPIMLGTKVLKPNGVLQPKISTAKNILELRKSSQSEFKGENGGNGFKNESNCLSGAHFSADYQTPTKDQTFREYTGIQYQKNDNGSKLAKVDFSSYALDVACKLCQTISESCKIKESLRVPGKVHFNIPLTEMEKNEKSKRESLEEYISNFKWRRISAYSNSNDKFVDPPPYSPIMSKSRKDSTAEVKRVEVEISGETFPTVEQETESSTASCKVKTTTEGDEVQNIMQNKEMTTTTRELEAELSNKDGPRNIHQSTPFFLHREDFVPPKVEINKPNFPLELKEMQSSSEKNIIEDKKRKESSNETSLLKLVQPASSKSIPNNMQRENSLERRAQQSESPITTTEKKMHIEISPKEKGQLKQSGLEPTNLKSSPQDIPKQPCHFNNKIEHPTITNVTVYKPTEVDVKEKLLLKGEMDIPCKTRVVSKEQFPQATMLLEEQIEPTSATNQSVIVTTEHPKSIPEKSVRKNYLKSETQQPVNPKSSPVKKMPKENSPQKPRGLKPVNLKSRPDRNISKQSGHLKTKSKHVTATNETVDVAAESDVREKLLKVEMGANCECGIFPKDGCPQQKLPRRAEIEHVAAENDIKEELPKVEVDATCDSIVAPKEDCAPMKRSFKAEIEHEAATNESVDVTAENDIKDKLSKVEVEVNCECGIFPKDGCPQQKRPRKAEIEYVTVENDVKEKLPKVEVDTTCDSRVSIKDDCAQVQWSFQAKIENVAATNESVDVTAENDIKEKLSKVETGATCESGISLKGECTQAKQTHEAEIENVAAINESVDITEDGQAKFLDVTSESDVSLKEDWVVAEMPHESEIQHMTAANEAEVTTGEEKNSPQKPE